MERSQIQVWIQDGRRSRWFFTRSMLYPFCTFSPIDGVSFAHTHDACPESSLAQGKAASIKKNAFCKEIFTPKKVQYNHMTGSVHIHIKAYLPHCDHSLFGRYATSDTLRGWTDTNPHGTTLTDPWCVPCASIMWQVSRGDSIEITYFLIDCISLPSPDVCTAMLRHCFSIRGRWIIYKRMFFVVLWYRRLPNEIRYW